MGRGTSGTILKTTNGGSTWVAQPSGTSDSLLAIHFIDSNIGWAVGDGGTIVKTANGGITWVEQSSGTSDSLSAVHFYSANTGWAVGDSGTIRKTTNGGSTWVAQSSGVASHLNSVHFYSANTGWAVGDASTILKTTNGGTTWVAQPNSGASLQSVHFVNASTGWAVGEIGTILKTANGGATWIAQSSGTRDPLRSVHFVNAHTGWAVGGGGTILKTTNGGVPWIAQSSGTSNSLLAVHFVNAYTGWVVGDGGTILKTANGGANWFAQSSGTSDALYAVHFIDAHTGWAVGTSGTILKTTNGGSTWVAKPSGTFGPLYSVHFVDANTGWAVGGGGTILKTANGGASWVAQSSGKTSGLESVHFVDANTGWTVGPGTILNTLDGGATWVDQSRPGSVLHAVHFVDAYTGWAVGDATVLRTTNGGASWSAQLLGNSPLFSTHFADANTGWAVGAGGTILRWDAAQTGNVGSPYVAPHVAPPGPSEKPLIVFVGGMDSECEDKDSDELFGFLRMHFRGLGYETMIMPSKPRSGQLDVVDSAMAFGATSSTTDNLSSAQRISNRLMWEGEAGRDIILVGHSMGGLISRDYAARWKTLKAGCEPLAIIQLGTPNEGSPLGLLGQVKRVAGHDAVQALWSGGGYIRDFNESRKNAGVNQVPVYQYAGSYFPADAVSDTKWWEQGKQDWLLALLAHFGGAENDGLVSVDSVYGAPAEGVKDTMTVSAIHTHSGPYGQWGPTVAPHIVPQGWVHDENARVITDMRMAIDSISSTRLRSRSSAEASFQHASLAADGAVPSGVTEYWRVGLRQVLPASAIATSEYFSLEGTSTIVNVTGSGVATAVTIESARGDVIGGAVIDDLEDGGTKLFERLEPGDYRLRVSAPGAAEGTEVEVSVVDCGPTVLRTTAPNSVVAGEQIKVKAAIAEREVVQGGSQLSARLGAGPLVPMRDDGVAPDDAGGDGIFAVSLPSVDTTGLAQVEVFANGGNSEGHLFERQGFTLVDVVEPRATLTGSFALGGLCGSSGRVTTVTVEAGVRAHDDCDLQVAADLAAGGTGALVSQSERVVHLSAGQTETVTVEFAVADLVNTLGAGDEYILSRLALLDLTEGGMSALEEASPSLIGTLPLSDMEYAGLTMSVVGSSPSSSPVTVLEGDAICTTETIIGVEVTLDDGASWYPAPTPEGGWDTSSTAWSCAFSLPEGEFVATARATGAQGAIPGTTESITFTVDRTAPVVEASIDDYYPVAETTVTIEASDTASYVDGVSYRLDGAEPVTVVAETLELPVSTGAHTIEYWATDAAGNMSEHVTKAFTVGERHTIAAVAGPGGSISPASDQVVDWGGSQTFLITPDPGFLVGAVLVDDEVVGTVSEYTFDNVTSDHSIIATFIPATLTVEPIAGTSRYATAIEASKKAFPDGAPCVVIATGSNWPDALGGGALAAAKGGPILLTQANALPADVLAEIRRLGAAEAVVLGGESAVGKPVFDALATELGPLNVTRIGGAGRYQTAEMIAEATVAELGASYDGTVFVATGANFPDALGASPLAAAKGWPLLLSGPGGLSASTLSTLDDIGATKALVLGGTAVVPDSVMAQLAGRSPERLQGAGRYGTARVVAQYGVDHAGLGWDKVAIATGENFPDALAGGVLQGLDGSVMLLTPGASLHAEPQAALSANKDDIHTVRFLGGESAVKPATRAQVQALLN